MTKGLGLLAEAPDVGFRAMPVRAGIANSKQQSSVGAGRLSRSLAERQS